MLLLQLQQKFIYDYYICVVKKELMVSTLGVWDIIPGTNQKLGG